MWWGGGTASKEEPQDDEDGKEVMEILSEEDSVKDDNDDDDDDEDFQKIRDQFTEQQALLGELRGVLKSNTDKLANKEREVQVCHFNLFF